MSSGPYCDGESILVPEGGFSNLSAVGWLDNMESFYCLFKYDPADNMKYGLATAARLVPPVATSKLPLVPIPISDQTRPGLGGVNLAQDNATSSVHITSARETGGVEKRTPGSAVDPPRTTRNIERGIPGGCYICSEPNWGGECEYVHPPMGTCYSMENWPYLAASYGPDQDATCYISE